MNPERCDELAHALLEKKCRIMDYLPAQLPPGSRGRYFDVECCLLNHYDRFGLRERITAALLKLLCYRHLRRLLKKIARSEGLAWRKAGR